MARKRKKRIDEAPENDQQPVTEESSVDAEECNTAEDESVTEDLSEEDGFEEEPVAEEDVDPVDELQTQLAEMKDRYMRTRAELDNFRKRKVKEIEDVRRNAKINTLEEIMPVMDQFQMAVTAIEQASDMETIKMGMTMIQTTFNRCFENLGVEPISAAGKEFDPNLHEAITMEASEEVEADHVIREWKAGYQMGDYLIRPASVVVSSGPAVAEDAEEGAEEELPEADDSDMEESDEEVEV